ncbi:MAG: M43 family zinc metalloprotease [Chitinophagales bacterium]|nr:M43 family zinc metalloprotease [Chitinophagales bacterium]
MRYFLSTATLFSWSLLFSSLSVSAQDKCATIAVQQQLLYNDPTLAQRIQQAKDEAAAYRLAHPFAEKTGTIITIPVVVHVVHNGEPIDSGTNISEEQIRSQIEVLNEDYRRFNADTVNTPSVFKSVAADIEVHFCLAERDPEGNVTNGIDRIDGNRLTWTQTQVDNTLKPGSIWDREYYLNIWTVKFGGASASLLGYAIQPGNNADIDGVVIGYQYFGRVGNLQPPFNLGRTTTHEVGHWLGLNHPWSATNDPGTSSCADDDGIADTPNSEFGNYGCPSFPHISCGNGPNGDMFMNYMDYTNDACLNMFTSGQKSVMLSTLQTSRSNIQISGVCTWQWPVGIKEYTMAKDYAIAYDAAQQEMLIMEKAENTEVEQIAIFSMTGQAVGTGRMYGKSLRMPLADAASGLYLVKVFAKEASFSKKVMVTH